MAESISEKVRYFIKTREEPLNILIVGRAGVGKSTLINSFHMAVAQTWNEFALFGGGAPGETNTTHFMPFTMFKPKYMATPVDGYQETIKLWDMPGMENLAEDTYIELIGLILEGRVPENTNLIPLLKNTSLTGPALAGRFPKIVKERRFHRVVMVCDATRDVPENLVQTVRRAARTPDGRRIPIFLVFSKMDGVTGDKTAYKQRRDEALSAFQLTGNEGRLFETGLYSDRNDDCSKGLDKNFNPNDKIDTTLLTMWRFLLNPAYDEGLRHVGEKDTRGPCLIL